MTRFHIILSNHDAMGREALRDIVDPVSHGLRRNGVELTEGERMDSGAMNLFVEAFDQKLADELCQGGYRFGVICTEKLTGDTLNGDPVTAERAAHLKRVLPCAAFVWCLVNGDYREFCERPQWLTLRFDPDALWQMAEEPQCDISAFGSITIDRSEFIEGLSALGLSVSWPKRIVPKIQRDAIVRSAKRVVNFTANNKIGDSHSRIWAAVHLRRPLVMQHTQAVIDSLRYGWRNLEEAQLVEYRQRGDMKVEMADLLERSL